MAYSRERRGCPKAVREAFGLDDCRKIIFRCRWEQAFTNRATFLRARQIPNGIAKSNQLCKIKLLRDLIDGFCAVLLPMIAEEGERGRRSRKEEVFMDLRASCSNARSALVYSSLGYWCRWK